MWPPHNVCTSHENRPGAIWCSQGKMHLFMYQSLSICLPRVDMFPLWLVCVSLLLILKLTVVEFNALLWWITMKFTRVLDSVFNRFLAKLYTNTTAVSMPTFVA
jgi:hypothetical protein